MKTCLILCLLAANSQAQTNLVITTNFVTADPAFREANGRLYNIERSYLWDYMEGDCDRIFTNGFILRLIEKRNVYGSDPSVRVGNFIGSSGGPRIVGTQETYGDFIYVRNVPKGERPHIGERWRAKLIFGGKIQIGDEEYRVFDFGLPHVVAVVRTNSVASLTNSLTH